MKSQLLRPILAALAVLALSASCAADTATDTAAAPTDESAGELTEQAQPEVAEQAEAEPEQVEPEQAEQAEPEQAEPVQINTELPPVFSSIASVGDLGLYYSADEGQMTLHAFDATTMVEQYQVPANPLGRLRGVGQNLVTDADLGMFFLTGLEDPEGFDAYLAGHNAATGEELWRTKIAYYTSQPFDCSPSLVCVRSLSEQTQIDKTSGDVVDTFTVDDRRVLLNRPGLTITTRLDDFYEFDGLIGAMSGTNDVLWEISGDQLAIAVGQPLDPSNGWGSYFDEATNSAIVMVALADGSAEANFGITAAGELAWGRTDLLGCVSSVDERPFILCSGDRSELVRLDGATGETTWSVPLTEDVLEIVFDGTDVLVWDWFGTGGSYRVVNQVTGEVADGTEPAICGAVVEPHEFLYPDGAAAMWSGSEAFSVCYEDGFFLAPDLIRENATATDYSQPVWLTDEFGVPVIFDR